MPRKQWLSTDMTEKGRKTSIQTKYSLWLGDCFKPKLLIFPVIFAVTAKLICGFVFTYAKCCFSHSVLFQAGG